MEFCISADQLRKALADIEKAEAHGFNHCLAVVRLASAGYMIHNVRVEYTDLVERAHPTDGNFNWGRFQGVTRRNSFDNKKQKLIPIKGAK